jgi:hypothetical protein
LDFRSEPIYNVDAACGVASAESATPSINGATPLNRSNRYGLGSGSFAPGIPRAFQFGVRVGF